MSPSDQSTDSGVRAKVSIVVACSENGYIGKDNKLLWHIPEDLKQFRKLTEGHTVIMGNNTYKSLNRKAGLPNRTNLVISRSFFEDRGWSFTEEHGNSLFMVRDIENAIWHARDEEEVFVIGGSMVYRDAIFRNLADKIYLTVVHQKIDGDAKFPLEYVMRKYKKIEERQGDGVTYMVLERP